MHSGPPCTTPIFLPAVTLTHLKITHSLNAFRASTYKACLSACSCTTTQPNSKTTQSLNAFRVSAYKACLSACSCTTTQPNPTQKQLTLWMLSGPLHTRPVFLPAVAHLRHACWGRCPVQCMPWTTADGCCQWRLPSWTTGCLAHTEMTKPVTWC